MEDFHPPDGVFSLGAALNECITLYKLIHMKTGQISKH